MNIVLIKMTLKMHPIEPLEREKLIQILVCPVNLRAMHPSHLTIGKIQGASSPQIGKVSIR